MGVVNSMKAQLSFKRCKRKRKKNQKKNPLDVLCTLTDTWDLKVHDGIKMKEFFEDSVRQRWTCLYFNDGTENQNEGAKKRKKTSLSGSVQDTKQKN